MLSGTAVTAKRTRAREASSASQRHARRAGRLAGTASACLLALALAGTAHAALTPSSVLIVDSAGDEASANATSATCATSNATCTLRAAIEAANASGAPARIEFDIAGVGLHTIEPQSPLPSIAVPVAIDGYTQPGAQPASDASPSPTLEISLIGAHAGGGAGLTLAPNAAGSTISGLDLAAFSGYQLESHANDATFAGDVIGRLPGQPLLSNEAGLLLDGVSGDVVGGAARASQNVIVDVITQKGSSSACACTGVTDEGGTDNTIEGNSIGVTPEPGSWSALGGEVGVKLENATGDTLAGNVISDNETGGVEIHGGSGIALSGNDIGTLAGGETPAGNGQFQAADGVAAYNSPDLTIGGSSAGLGNVISANDGHGVYIAGASDAAKILDNEIGTDAAGNAFDSNVGPTTGERHWGNQGDGIYVVGGRDDVIGAPGAGNVLYSNAFTLNGVADVGQIVLDGAGASDPPTGAKIEGNLIGVSRAGVPFGEPAVGDADGIDVVSVASVQVGGPQAGEGNVVADTPYGGITLYEVGGGAVQDNLVGTNAAGTQAAGDNPSDFGEITLAESSNVLVGGARPGATGACAPGASCSAAWRALGPGNVASASWDYGRGGAFGISVQNGSKDTLEGNLVGTNLTGAQALGNGTCGIVVGEGSTGTLIGGAGEGEGNVVSGNGLHGIELDDARGTTVLGNRIGTNLAGTEAIPNASAGIDLADVGAGEDPTGPSQTTIGGAKPGEGNLVSGNEAAGIQAIGGSTAGLTILGNTIGPNATDSAPVENAGAGIELGSGVSDVRIGGIAGGEANAIADNGGDGVAVSGAAQIPIRGNSIFENAGLGIDLREGGNGAQAAPTLSSASASGAHVTVSGTLDAAPNTTYTIDYYESPPPAALEAGPPAERWIAAQTARTDASGVATLAFAYEAANPGELPLSTATATSPGGDTSEISAAVAAKPAASTLPTTGAPTAGSTPVAGTPAAVTGARPAVAGSHAAVAGARASDAAPSRAATHGGNATQGATPPLRLRLLTARAVVRDDALRLRIACAGGAPSAVCRGRVSLTTIARARGGRGSRTHAIELAHARYSIARGRRAIVVVRLARKAARLLRAGGRVRETASVHGARSASRTVRLRLG